MFLALSLLLLSNPAPDTQTPDLVDLEGLHKRFLFDLRYATEDNFAGVQVYAVGRCLLRPSVAERMVKAQKWLDTRTEGYRLLFKDCYRPVQAQRILYAAVKGTKKARYVANPNSRTGSIHSYGAAVDLTLANKNGLEVDMGTAYDHLGKEAEPRLEKHFLKQGKLTEAHVKARHVLRDAMKHAGMRPISNEWWHFNEAKASVIRRRYKALNISLRAFPKAATSTQ